VFVAGPVVTVFEPGVVCTMVWFEYRANPKLLFDALESVVVAPTNCNVAVVPETALIVKLPFNERKSTVTTTPVRVPTPVLNLGRFKFTGTEFVAALAVFVYESVAAEDAEAKAMEARRIRAR